MLKIIALLVASLWLSGCVIVEVRECPTTTTTTIDYAAYYKTHLHLL